MFIALINSSGDPGLAQAISRCMQPDWTRLAKALETVKLPDGAEGLTVGFAEGLPRTHFEQRRAGRLHSTITGINKQQFLAGATLSEQRGYLFDFVAESLERVEWPAETRRQVAEIFRGWRAALPADVRKDAHPS